MFRRKGDLLSPCRESRQRGAKGLRPFGNPRGFNVIASLWGGPLRGKYPSAYFITPTAAEVDYAPQYAAKTLPGICRWVTLKTGVVSKGGAARRAPPLADFSFHILFVRRKERGRRRLYNSSVMLRVTALAQRIINHIHFRYIEGIQCLSPNRKITASPL